MRAIRMMMTVAILIGFMTAISVNAQSVQSDYNRSFNFSSLKTFGFAVQNRRANDPLASDTLNNERIQTALESQLIANGYRMDGANADFAIVYHVTTKDKLNVQDFGYGPPRLWGGRNIRVDQYSEGTLLVDFIDTKTNQVIWRGRASGTLEMKGVDKKISKSVEKLVKQFVKDTTKKS